MHDSIGNETLTDARFAPLTAIMERDKLDAVALVPGVNFKRILGRDFHQMERPLMVVVPLSGKPVAVVPNLEMASFDKLGLDAAVFDWRDEEGFENAFARAGIELGQVKRIGVEGQRMRVFDYLALQRNFKVSEIVDAHNTISEIRALKSKAEVATIKRAIELSEKALEATLGQIRLGMTEREIEMILRRELFAHGAEALAFDPIVAAGDNSAQPHASARADYTIKKGDALLFDFGGSVEGFSADITRTFFIQEASERDTAFYHTVLAANQAGRDASGPDISAHDVDDAVQRVLEASNFAEFRRHKTGHGLGLDVHEAPQIMRGNHAKLAPGMVFTIEPGLYELGKIGVRIEDDVVVSDDGIEVLTSFPRDLRILPC